jgi:hypothetical protein
MDGPTAQYLDPIPGIDAAMWVPPSRWQLFWVRRAPALFAPALGTGRGLARPGWPESGTLSACRSS